MPEFKDLPDDFRCPYRDGCPYLEGLSTGWVLRRYQEVGGTECHYEYQLEELHRQLDEERRQRQRVQLENQQLQAQLQALHRRQFKGRKAPATPAPEDPPVQPKKRGAPPGHPPWQRAQPKHIDQVVQVPAPKRCPHCGGADLQPLAKVQEHVQEDIVLEPRTLATCYVHRQAYCPGCDRNVLGPGPGELLGSYCSTGPSGAKVSSSVRVWSRPDAKPSSGPVANSRACSGVSRGRKIFSPCAASIQVVASMSSGKRGSMLMPPATIAWR